MSTRSFIAKQIGDNEYLTVYCHNGGYLSYNGTLLGDGAYLAKGLQRDPDMPHGFDCDKRQKDVTVAYGRDRGDKAVAAKIKTMQELDDPNNWTEYVYIFTRDNEWKYFAAGHSKEGLRDVRADLKMQMNETRDIAQTM